MVSSDEARHASRNFDVDLSRALAAHDRICYDKNVPNGDGVGKLCRSLSAAATEHGGLRVRVQLVAPRSLNHDAAWARVASRTADHDGLNVFNVTGGEAGCYRLFKNIFCDPSRKYLPVAKRLPSTVATDAFWGDLEATERLAAALCAPAPESLPTVEELARAHREEERAVDVLRRSRQRYGAKPSRRTALPPRKGKR